MNKNKVLKTNKGITLITLIITVIMMLILLGISLATIDDEVVGEAQSVKNDVNDIISQGQEKIDNLVGELEDITESTESE